MKTIPIALLLLFIGTLTISCDQNNAQKEFEELAYTAASGITVTNDQGTVLDTDTDDWRTAPLFQGLIEFNPPFPNPVSVSDVITFEVEVTGIQSVSGLEVIVRYQDDTFGSIYFDPQSPLPPGLTSFRINPQELGKFGTVESARGLHRVFIFDRNNQLITYGDIRVQ